MYSPNCSIPLSADGIGTLRRLNTRSPSVVWRRTSRLTGTSLSTHDVSGSAGVSAPPQTAPGGGWSPPISLPRLPPSPVTPPGEWPASRSTSLVFSSASLVPSPASLTGSSVVSAARSVSSDAPCAACRSQPNVASNAEFTSWTIGSPSWVTTRTIGSETVSTTASNRSRCVRSSRSASSARQASASFRLIPASPPRVSVSIRPPAVTNTRTPNSGRSSRWTCVSSPTDNVVGNAGSSDSWSHSTARVYPSSTVGLAGTAATCS